MRRVELESWDPAFEWDGLTEFLESEDIPDGVQRIRVGYHNGSAVFLDLFVRLRPSRPLAVHFYGAQRIPRKTTEPTFSGLRMSSELNASFVIFHDPTLSLTTEIGLGWYEGFEGFAAAPLIQSVIGHLAQSYGAPRTVLWGGSAGGYAALRNVGRLPNAAALVWNPQTSIPRYQKSPVQKYAKVAFGTDDLELSVKETSEFQLDLTRLPEPNWSTSPIVYLQEADDRHVRRHLSYLLKGYKPSLAREVTQRDTMFGIVGDHFYLHLSQWDPGHRRPPKRAIKEFLTSLLHSDYPVADAPMHLESASHELIRLSHSPQRKPFNFEMAAPIRQPESLRRVMQWGSRFGREVTARAFDEHPILVTRSVIGQSIITAYSIRKRPPPNTALDLTSAEDNEHRLMLLRDRRASASTALSEDTELDFVILDLLEEVRGTVNAGRGFIVTNHGHLRRIDGGPLVEREFGSDQHRSLWLSRLTRLDAAIEESNATLVVLDIDATNLTPSDWDWLHIPQPSEAVLMQWHHRVKEARERLKNAIWIEETDRSNSLGSTIGLTAGNLASVIAQTQN